MKNRYLITGGAGFIGSHVVDALLASGADVTVLDIKPKRDAENLADVLSSINYIQEDIKNFSALEEVCKEHTHVLHLAAIVSVPRSVKDPMGTHETNVNGTLAVLEAARKNGIKRVVYASSAAVYGDTETVPVSETEECAPTSPYGLHKVINEAYARLYAHTFELPTIGLRFFNVFGERQDPSSPYSGVISIFADAMAAGRTPTIFGDGKATRDFVYVGNVVQACLSALGGAGTLGDVYNVGTGEQTSINELVSAINEVLGTNIRSTYDSPRRGDIRHSCASIEKTCREFDYQVEYDFTSGLRQLLIA